MRHTVVHVKSLPKFWINHRGEMLDPLWLAVNSYPGDRLKMVAKFKELVAEILKDDSDVNCKSAAA